MTVIDARPALLLPNPQDVVVAGRALGGRQAQEGPWPSGARSASRALPASLRITIMAPRTDIGGGARILFEHANRLLDRGHQVSVVSHLPAPNWFPLRASFVQAPVGLRMIDAAPISDLIVCGYWEMLREVAAAHLAPVVHFEQGDFHLFEELPPQTMHAVRANLEAADAHTAVSGAVQEILKGRYGISSSVIPNAVDTTVFHARPRNEGGRRYVLSVGWDGNAFKGIDEIRQLATQLKGSHPDVDVVWVTPKPPVAGLGDISRAVVAPSQEELAELYRSAAAYVCASHYESFPLPPMEAMTSGTPVVTTANPGSLEYCRDGENALVVPIGDVVAMHEALTRVLDDPDLSERLQADAALTSATYTWDAIVDRLEAVYRRVATEFATPLADEGWTPTGLVATPVDAAATERIGVARRRSGAARLLVPVRRPGVAGYDVYQWQVVATRPHGSGDCRVFAAHASTEPPSGLTYQRPFDLMRAGRYQDALNLFRAAWARGGTAGARGALPRWIAWCLLELGRPQEAFTTIVEGLPHSPDNPDYYCFAAVIGDRLGLAVDFDAVAELVRVTGAGARYEDFLADPAGIVEALRARALLGATP